MPYVSVREEERGMYRSIRLGRWRGDGRMGAGDEAVHGRNT